MDEEVFLDSAEEEERFVGWYCKFILMGLQREIFLKIHALKREREQERLSLGEGSSLQPMRQGRSSTENINQYIERKIVLHIHPLNSIKNCMVN